MFIWKSTHLAFTLLNRLFAFFSESQGLEKGEGESRRTHPAGAGAAGYPGFHLETHYRRHAGQIFWVCQKYLKSKEEAEDMVHHVFLKAQDASASFQGTSQVYTWLYRIAVNESIMALRRKKHDSQTDPEVALDSGDGIDGETQAQNSLTLEKILSMTDEETRSILFLMYEDGMTQEEVAKHLGISRNTLNRRLNQLRLRWREE